MTVRVLLLSATAALAFSHGQGIIGAGSSGLVPPPAQINGPEQPKEPARIQGTITNAATGAPLKRVNVILMATQPSQDAASLVTTTDAEGKFAMAELPPGQYRLSAERTGYVRTEYGARGANRMGTTITLAPGQELKQIRMEMLPHAVISGRVTDEDGEPVAYVQVQTMSHRYMNGRRQLMPSSSGMTNDLGEYRIFGLPPGRYYVSATAMNRTIIGAVEASAAPGNQSDSTYAPTYYPGTNDSSAAVPLAVAAGKPVSNIDLSLKRTLSVRVRGKITNPGVIPGQGVAVFLGSRNTAIRSFDRNMTMARPDGRFEIRGVLPGSYSLQAQAANGETRYFARMQVEIGNGPVENVELTLAPGNELTGSIKIEGEGITPSAVRVYLEPREFGPMSGGGMAAVKDDGTFRIPTVTPDTYRVRTLGGANQFYVKSVYAGQEEIADGELTIAPGTAPSLTILISTAGGQVSGIVKGDNDAVVPGASVVLVPETARRDQSGLYKVASTDQYGKFTLKAIAPGSYKLFAWETVEPGEWMDPEFIQPFDAKGKSLTFRENSAESVELTALKSEPR